MSIRDIVVSKEPDGWFVISDQRLGPYTRELAVSQAKGLAFAIRSSGGEANLRFSDRDEEPPVLEPGA
jgi:hypothetical protein